MLKATKIILIVGGALVALGLAVTIIGFTTAAGSAKRAGKEVYEQKEEIITEDFDNIKICEISHDIEIRESDDGEVKIEYWDSEKYVHKIEVKGDTLSIGVNTYSDDTPWWERISFDIDWVSGEMGEEHQMIVYLPEGEYGNIELDSVSADISVPENYTFEDITVNTTSGEIKATCKAGGKVDISSVSGEIQLANGTPSDIEINTTSGNANLDDMTVAGLTNISTISGEVTLTNVVTDDVDINTTSGDIRFNDLTTGTANIDTTSGEVTGTIAGDHEYDTSTVSGDIDLPSSINGEPEISISTVSGDISLKAA